ncbi:MAG TPA: hypothetical protein VM694_28855 [Polyangium sp.]|nr:hypothetical protein [Polyangium sp.]
MDLPTITPRSPTRHVFAKHLSFGALLGLLSACAAPGAPRSVEGPGAGDHLEIAYTRPSFVDVVVANQDCGIGAYRYDHHMSAPRCAIDERAG